VLLARFLSLESSLQFGTDFLATGNDRAEIVMDGFTPKAVGMTSRDRVRRGRVAGFRMLNASASRVFASAPVLRLS